MSDLVRVAVTRDEPPGGPLSHALRLAGFEPVLCPAVREANAPDLAALRQHAGALERFDWLVVASARAVSALIAARDGRPLPPNLRAAAVGEQTAAALRSAGAVDVLLSERAGAGALLETLRAAGGWRGRRVSAPRAAEGGRDLAEGLRALGADVEEVVAYRTEPRSGAELAADWQRAQPQAAVVTSPSAARALVAGVGREALHSLRAVVAIGSTTARALGELGIDAAVPVRTDFAGAVALLGERLSVKGGMR